MANGLQVYITLRRNKLPQTIGLHCKILPSLVLVKCGTFITTQDHCNWSEPTLAQRLKRTALKVHASFENYGINTVHRSRTLSHFRGVGPAVIKGVSSNPAVDVRRGQFK